MDNHEFGALVFKMQDFPTLLLDIQYRNQIMQTQLVLGLLAEDAQRSA